LGKGRMEGGKELDSFFFYSTCILAIPANHHHQYNPIPIQSSLYIYNMIENG
jgi:hypothetical protein